jgi:hypothetical protein
MALARHNKKAPATRARASLLRPGLPFYVGFLTDKFLPTFVATIRDGPEAEAPLKVSVLVTSSPQPLTRARGVFSPARHPPVLGEPAPPDHRRGCNRLAKWCGATALDRRQRIVDS